MSHHRCPKCGLATFNPDNCHWCNAGWGEFVDLPDRVENLECGCVVVMDHARDLVHLTPCCERHRTVALMVRGDGEGRSRLIVGQVAP